MGTSPNNMGAGLLPRAQLVPNGGARETGAAPFPGRNLRLKTITRTDKRIYTP